MKARQSERGFSLLEIIIVLIVLSLLTTVVMDTFGPWVQFRARIETERRLAEARAAFEAAYRASAATVEANENAVLVFQDGTVDPATPDANGVCQSTAATFTPVARFAVTSAGVLGRDGGQAPLCVFITPRLSATVQGTTLYYHTAAIVSGGPNGVLESGACTTTLSATGALTLCGDDSAALLDGYALALENFQTTLSRMSRTATAYQGYFSTRYQLDPTRDVSIDYFASSGTPAGRWDGAGAMPSSGCAAAAPLIASNGPSPHDVLGLSTIEVTDAYGQVMTYDNCSDLARSPTSSDAAMRLPPYTAIVQTTLPGGVVVRQTAVGTF